MTGVQTCALPIWNILNAANSVIANNRGRKEKSLWTENGEGELIRLRQFDTAFDEADFIGEDIKSAVRQGGSYNDSAVLCWKRSLLP